MRVSVVIAVSRERRDGETRVAATPASVKILKGLGARVLVETGAGLSSSIPDADYEAAGAEIAADTARALGPADILLKVRGPAAQEISALKPGTVVIGLLDAWREKDTLKSLASAGLSAIAMEFVPRITRAQAMDALSSQANLAGYRAVIEAAHLYGRGFPMMMTAAGTVAAAKVFVMGAGVAGLQAIATARRLGAVVTATDVRPAAKEQVESLGAKFIAVEDEEFRAAETAAGYARPMSAEYQARQAELTASHITKQDVVITTALIPGRPAPRLVSAAHIGTMKPGAVLIDLAVESGGNVEGSRPDQVVTTPGGVMIAGFSNLPGRIAADASALYARNLAALAGLLVRDGAVQLDREDEIIGASLITHGGQIVHEGLK
ncbi:MAG: Re/Si-specific NAD(P)(+) transhydrogenase subunit alpha [Brevundimonas sp.]|jgi:H+-translocating NAD(P) transhydrogenase subunit alpha|uniref:Re/Si-specific NAD(P)(+) transhydrogenase subunit alpha n=1 Tax=Brevundimonas sp. TaxID=1871086 RepID=UPI00391E01BC